MILRKDELIVPIKDRRRRRRILTLKNLKKAGMIALALYLLIILDADLRNPRRASGFGRLYDDQLSRSTSVKQPVHVIETAPIDDITFAHPDDSRQSLLRSSSIPGDAPQNSPAETDSQGVAPVVIPQRPLASRGVAISGGPEGVVIVQPSAPQPLLRGGFMRQ